MTLLKDCDAALETDHEGNHWLVPISDRYKRHFGRMPLVARAGDEAYLDRLLSEIDMHKMVIRTMG